MVIEDVVEVFFNLSRRGNQSKRLDGRVNKCLRGNQNENK